MRIKKALQTIKGYCEKHTACIGCSLICWCDYMTINSGCVPADWDVEEMLKKRRGEQDEAE